MIADSMTVNRARLRKFLEEENESLFATLKMYAWRAGLPVPEDAAYELLDNLTVEALEHAVRFDPQRPPRAWLLGIAANLIRRKQAEYARLNRREPLVGDLDNGGWNRDGQNPGAQSSDSDGSLSEDELFDRLAEESAAAGGPLRARTHLVEREIESRQEMEAALNMLSPSDRQVVHLFAQGGMDGEELAQTLNLKPGAARVRLHRALARLRQVWSGKEV